MLVLLFAKPKHPALGLLITMVWKGELFGCIFVSGIPTAVFLYDILQHRVLYMQIYLTAGHMYGLEDRVRELEGRLEGEGRRGPVHSLSDLEAQVVKAAVQVTRSEKEVSSDTSMCIVSQSC